MAEKKFKKEKVSFDERDLDQVVLGRLQANSERESEMIANFNAKVNSEEHFVEVNRRGVNSKEESGGPSGLEPTRYGDWERKGRCYDF